MKGNGICTESSYPYTSGSGERGKCKRECTAAVKLAGFVNVPARDGVALRAAVSITPVSVAVVVDSKFQFYKRGIFDNGRCSDTVNHGVLIVGYGTDGGKPYWKVRNSWGKGWGEKGYIRIASSNKNQCCVSDFPSYPTGVTAAGPSPGPPPSDDDNFPDDDHADDDATDDDGSDPDDDDSWLDDDDDDWTDDDNVPDDDDDDHADDDVADDDGTDADDDDWWLDDDWQQPVVV